MCGEPRTSRAKASQRPGQLAGRRRRCIKGPPIYPGGLCPKRYSPKHNQVLSTSTLPQCSLSKPPYPWSLLPSTPSQTSGLLVPYVPPGRWVRPPTSALSTSSYADVGFFFCAPVTTAAGYSMVSALFIHPYFRQILNYSTVRVLVLRARTTSSTTPASSWPTTAASSPRTVSPRILSKYVRGVQSSSSDVHI